MIGQFCAWCRGPHAERTRRDAKFCSKRCRQNSHSFGVRASTEASVLEQRRIAYADPPYPGLAHYYIERREVDHVALLAVLRTFDGWALSTSARALQSVLTLCPPGVHVAAWLRGARVVKSHRAISTWEPVIVSPARSQPSSGPALDASSAAAGDASSSTRRTELESTAMILPFTRLQAIDGLTARGRHRAYPGALVGMKPPAFSEWLFLLLGARPGDEFSDLFPGSGAVSEAWRRFSRSEPTGRSWSAMFPPPDAMEGLL